MEKLNRPPIEVSDIFRLAGEDLEPISAAQRKVLRDITNCRTSVLGGHKDRCDACGNEEISYNSCRNRHCPKCQFNERLEWLQARMDELLPVEYFHVVFTVPHILNRLALQNKKIFYNILFKASSETLKEVAEKNLKAEAGFISILHTWGQNLMDHPHVHIVIPGGGLSFNKEKWISCKKGYLFPIKILSTVYRGKLLSQLEKAFNQNKLEFYGSIEHLSGKNNFKQLLVESAKKQWVVYAKKPFAGPAQVLEYIGNYTHRVAISNHRLKSLKNNHVSFIYRDYSDDNKNKIMKLHVTEFTRRFLLHVLPYGYVRIRHYGFMGNRFRKVKIETCKKILEAKKSLERQVEKYKELLLRIREKTKICPACKKGKMIIIEKLEPLLNLFMVPVTINDTS